MGLLGVVLRSELAAPTNPTPEIFGVRDRLKMARIDTGTIPTLVIDDKSGRDWAIGDLESDPMRHQGATTMISRDPEQGVTVIVDQTLPLPAFIAVPIEPLFGLEALPIVIGQVIEITPGDETAFETTLFRVDTNLGGMRLSPLPPPSPLVLDQADPTTA
jgi:hypothetical protein